MKKIFVLLIAASLFVVAPGCGSGVPEQTDENTVRLKGGKAGDDASVRDKGAEMKMSRGPKAMDKKMKDKQRGQ